MPTLTLESNLRIHNVQEVTRTSDLRVSIFSSDLSADMEKINEVIVDFEKTEELDVEMTVVTDEI